MIKTCGKCNETKPAGEFYRVRDRPQSPCKMCKKKYNQSRKGTQSMMEAQRKYNQSEKRRRSARKARLRYRQSEQGKRVRRQYEQSEKHKQYQRQYKRQYRREYQQSEKYKQSQRQYRQSERGKQVSRRNSLIRRTRKTKAGGSFTDAEWRRLCEFYDFRCLKCNVKFPTIEDFEPDHIKAVSRGGTGYIWNIQPLCKPCNMSKHNKEIDYRKTLPDWINRDGPIWIQGSFI